MNKAVYIAPEDQDEVDLGWMREALVMVSPSPEGRRRACRASAAEGRKCPSIQARKKNMTAGEGHWV